MLKKDDFKIYVTAILIPKKIPQYQKKNIIKYIYNLESFVLATLISGFKK